MIEIVLLVMMTWLGVGFLVSIWFQISGLAKLDPGIKSSSIFFRLLIMPGLVALWPILLRRAMSPGSETPPDQGLPFTPRFQRRQHLLLTSLVMFLIPVICGYAIIVREKTPLNEPLNPELLTAQLPVLIESTPDYFETWDIITSVRSDHYGWQYQLELDIRDDIPLNQPMVYWMPEFSGQKKGQITSQLIGSIQGQGIHRFTVPATLMEKKGDWVILSHLDQTALHPGLRRDS